VLPTLRQAAGVSRRSEFAGTSPGTALSRATSWSPTLSTRATGELSRAALWSPTLLTRAAGELSRAAS